MNTLIISIIVLVIIALVLFWILKKAAKVAVIMLGIIILFFIIGGFFAYSDAKSMQKSFEESSNLYLFEQENLVAGFSTNESNNPNPLNSGDIAEFNSDYSDNLENIKNDFYKLYIFKKKAFDSVESVELENQTYDKDFIITLIDSETPLDDYLDNLLIKQGVPSEQRQETKQEMKSNLGYSDSEFRGMLFASLFNKAISEQGPVFIFRQYKKGNVIVYKETALFRLIDFIPTNFVKNLFAKTTSAVKEKVM